MYWILSDDCNNDSDVVFCILPYKFTVVSICLIFLLLFLSISASSSTDYTASSMGVYLLFILISMIEYSCVPLLSVDGRL